MLLLLFLASAPFPSAQKTSIRHDQSVCFCFCLLFDWLIYCAVLQVLYFLKWFSIGNNFVEDGLLHNIFRCFYCKLLCCGEF